MNLNALASRFLRTWRRRWGSVTMRRGQSGRERRPSSPSSLAWRRARTPGAAPSRSSSTGELGHLDGDRARLDLGQVEDAVEQLSRSLPEEWITLAYSTWWSVMLSSGLSSSCSARISRLLSGVRSSWRHVGDELGLVLRRDGELAGLLLDQALGLLDLVVLVLGLDVLLGEQRGLPAEVLVGLAQLLLLGAQLLGLGLRLLEQVLGERVAPRWCSARGRCSR